MREDVYATPHFTCRSVVVEGPSEIEFSVSGGPGAEKQPGGREKTKTRKRAQGPGAPHENRHIPSAREGVTDVTVV